MSFTTEKTLAGFVNRWIEFTGDWGDFVPADLVWQAMLHSAGMAPDKKKAWGLSRKDAFEELRDLLPLVPRQHLRYYRPATRRPGGPSGYTAACYERIRLAEYAIDAMKMSPRVRRRIPALVN